jgi:subfamily B ATP-binding cassette protein MsbA
MAARTARALNSPVVELIAIAGVMLVTLVAAYYLFEVEQGQGDARGLVKVLFALGAAGASFKPLANLNNDLNEAAAAAERIDEVLQLPIEPARYDGGKRGRRLPRHRESVEFRDVSFVYPGTDEAAIRGVNLRVVQGTTCAIVGGNGSGKTTLLNLLPRLHEPTEGQVLIDGVDLSDCTLRSVRRQMAVVNQDTILFEGTIADNIAYGARHCTREDVIVAAQRAHAHEFISQLPDGYDTAIGEWGSRLSGGQRQRLAIARAILRDPAILILDEATSQIDSESEARINEALNELTRDRTTFVIAHRLSTVMHADMIVVMFQGGIADVGTHEELIDRCDTYQMLYQRQFPGG